MASNTVTTTSTVISDLTNSTSLDGLLKTVYTPYINNTLFNDTSFTALIETSTDMIDYEGQQIVMFNKTQRGGNSGSIAEGGDWIDNVPMKGKQGTETLKYHNLYFSLSGPSIRAARSSRGSAVNLVTDTINDTLEGGKNDLERMLMGSGQGILGIAQSYVAGTNTITVDGDPYFDTQFLPPGTKIELHGTLGTARTITLDDSSTATYMTVSSLTKGSKKTGAVTQGTIVVDSYASGGTANDYIVRKGSYLTSTTTCLEPHGLLNLVSDGTSNTGTICGAETSTRFTTIWGIDRTAAATSYMKSNVKNIAAELDEDVLLDILVDMKYQYQADPNLLLVTPRAFLKYFDNSKDDRRFNTMDAVTIINGVQGMGVQLGDKRLMLTSLASVPSGLIYMLDTTKFKFASMTNGYDWVTQKGGGVLTQKEGSDSQFAAAVNYFNFVCTEPNRQFKGYGVTE